MFNSVEAYGYERVALSKGVQLWKVFNAQPFHLQRFQLCFRHVFPAQETIFTFGEGSRPVPEELERMVPNVLKVDLFMAWNKFHVFA